MSINEHKQRLNFYTIIHKALRYKLYNFAMALGKADFDEVEIQCLQRQFSEIKRDLMNHAKVENKYLHPFIEKYLKEDVARLEAEHVKSDDDVLKLDEDMIAISQEPDLAKRQAMGHQFYLAYNHFVAKFMAHLHDEECVVMPKLWPLVSDQELFVPHLEVAKSYPPEEMEYYMGMFNLALNTQEKSLFN